MDPLAPDAGSLEGEACLEILPQLRLLARHERRANAAWRRVASDRESLRAGRLAERTQAGNEG